MSGTPQKENLRLNEDSLWSSAPMDRVNPDAKESLEKVRRLVKEFRQDEAFALASRALGGIPVSMANYEYLGGLILELDARTVEHYTRRLDLKTSIAKVSFTSDEMTYTREYLASRPDNVMAIHLTSEGEFSFSAAVERGETLNRREHFNEKVENGTIVMGGTVGNYGRVEFAAGFTVVTNGTVTTLGRTVVVEQATSATVYISAWTNYRQAKPRLAVIRDLEAAASKGYTAIRQDHVRDYQASAQRVVLDLGTSSTAQRALCTSERIAKLKNSFDPELVSTYFQFGRHLLHSSSRSGTLPANLQGIWSCSVEPYWGSKYTININLGEVLSRPH